MRKSFKKGLAMVLAAAMAFSTPVAVDRTVAGAAETSLPAPVATYDFASAEGVAVDNSAAADKSFAIKDGALTMTDSANFATISNPLKGKVDKGATVEFDFEVAADAKPANIEYGTVLGFDTPNLAMSAMPYFCYNGDDGWVDIKGTAPAAEEKHHYTFAISETDVTMYVDGIKVSNPAINKGDDAFTPETYAKAVLKALNDSTEAYFGKGAFWGAAAGTLDNVKFYNEALGESQVYKAATGKDISEIVPVSVTGGAVSIKEGGKLAFNFKVNDYQEKGIPVAVNDKITVATGSALTVDEDGNATYEYDTEGKDGKYTFAVASTITDEGVLYNLTGVAKAEITLVKVGDTMYEEDKSLITGDLGAAKGKTGNEFVISWTAAEGTVASAVVTGPDGKQVGNALTAPGSVTVTAAGNYNVTLAVTKDGKAATQTTGFSYRPAGAASTTDKFAKVTSAKPIFKSTFDTAASAQTDGVDLTGSKATIKDGVLVLASDTKQHGQYFAKMPSFTTDDFANGITFIADVNPSQEGDWTPYAVFGDGKLAQKGAAGTTYRWAITEGFSSIAGPSTNYHEVGYYGTGAAPGDAKGTLSCPISAPYTFDYFNTATNRNKWYTIAVTVKKNEMITYVNGVQIQKGTKDYTTIINGMKKASSNYLGASYWDKDTDADFAGSMDDVAVYNTALSAADIKTLTRTDAAKPGTGGDQTVTTSSAKVSKVTIKVPNKKSGKTIYMKVKDKLTLKATVTGSGKYSKSVTWKSSKKKVASVTSKGKVTAKKAGTAKITATSKTDKKKKATITIKVSKKAVKNKTLKLKATKKTLKKGKTYTIGIKKITKKTTEKITYKTSKKSVATVDAYGVVKAKKKGTAKITVKCGKKKATLKLTVKK